MERLEEKYGKEIAPKLQAELGKKNIFEVPKITKVVVSSGIGAYKEDKGKIETLQKELAKITGLRPKVNLSRKAVSAFKLRIGLPIGLTVTLRGAKMYDFVSKLINVALPRVRDFRGLNIESFDNSGNYSIGIKDYSIFPEVRHEEAVEDLGLQVNIKTSAKNKEEAQKLLNYLGFPFKKD